MGDSQVVGGGDHQQVQLNTPTREGEIVGGGTSSQHVSGRSPSGRSPRSVGKRKLMPTLEEILGQDSKDVATFEPPQIALLPRPAARSLAVSCIQQKSVAS